MDEFEKDYKKFIKETEEAFIFQTKIKTLKVVDKSKQHFSLKNRKRKQKKKNKISMFSE